MVKGASPGILGIRSPQVKPLPAERPEPYSRFVRLSESAESSTANTLQEIC